MFCDDFQVYAARHAQALNVAEAAEFHAHLMSFAPPAVTVCARFCSPSGHAMHARTVID